MNKNTVKLVTPIIATSLVFASVAPAIVVNAEENDANVVGDGTNGMLLQKITFDSPIHETANIDGEVYGFDVTKQQHIITNKISSDEGTITFVTNTMTNMTSVTSDYMTQNEIIALENSINNSSIDDSAATVTENEVEMYTLGAQKGSWAWSGWQTRKITSSQKYSLQSAIGVLGAKFGMYGAAAAALAGIWIQYNVHVGYFKVRVGTRLDTNPNWIWTKNQVRYYSDSSYKNLRGTKESKAFYSLIQN
ncbi:hypothetical protein HCJ66_01560 [Listeria sp. FSL L7-1582]|uniref:hypothetical protein n=1 Tax=Listeria portnoyi TaxID=2713504 RepID=UPI00164D30F1|nr:hypothetical protein [Listeria portnoyi]MBC6308230.1 hypothetical protein [Listeria portnoyi]